MIRNPAALTAVCIALVAMVWLASPYPLEWLGLGVFDPLDRICLVVLVLSVADTVWARVALR